MYTAKDRAHTGTLYMYITYTKYTCTLVRVHIVLYIMIYVHA